MMGGYDIIVYWAVRCPDLAKGWTAYLEEKRVQEVARRFGVPYSKELMALQKAGRGVYWAFYTQKGLREWLTAEFDANEVAQP